MIEPGGPPTERVSGLLAELAAATGLRFRLVLRDGAGDRPIHDSLGAAEDTSGDDESWPAGEGVELRATFAAPTGPGDASLRALLASFVPALVRMEGELLFFNRELAGLYGEVELLTSAAGTLGAGIALEKGVERLLGDLVEVTGTTTAELWTAQVDASRLVRFASSDAGATRALIELELSGGGLAETFRRGVSRSSIGDAGAELLVPVHHSTAQGLAGALGVLRVIRRTGRAFSPSERKLVTAIAARIGAAIESRRLSAQSLERERMLVELELAHHLQLKLLPEVADFVDCADIAARCEPAESVGGDFYHLFRLGGRRVGVMLGDVSSHGYSAGLIMALTMSAASLVVRERDGPGAVLAGIHHELVRRLESTDMYMTLCYAVLDPDNGRLCYANAGHPHAFRIGPTSADRLEALNPPLGIAEFDHYDERDLAWSTGQDMLLMFTDGLSETIRADRLWSDDLILDAIRRNGHAPACDVIDGLFEIASAAGAPPVDDRTALILK